METPEVPDVPELPDEPLVPEEPDEPSEPEVYISETDLDGLGIDPILGTLTDSTNNNKSVITFRLESNQIYYDSAYVTAQTDNGGWRTLDITHIDKSGWNNVGNSDATFMAIELIGDKGSSGSSGTSGSSGSSGTSGSSGSSGNS